MVEVVVAAKSGCVVCFTAFYGYFVGGSASKGGCGDGAEVVAGDERRRARYDGAGMVGYRRRRSSR